MPDYMTTDNRKVSGGTRVDGTGVDNCVAACDADRMCSGFDLNPAGTCWLTLGGQPPLEEPSPGEQVVHYRKRFNCGGRFV